MRQRLQDHASIQDSRFEIGNVVAQENVDRRRRDMIFQSFYESSRQPSMLSGEQSPAVASVNYNQTHTQGNGTTDPASSNPYGAAHATIPRPERSVARRSSSMTLSSAETLIALANLGARKVEEPPKQPESNSFPSFLGAPPRLVPANHGFGTGTTVAPADSTSGTRAIPSYADIRSSQANGAANSFISYNEPISNGGGTTYAASAADGTTEYYTERVYNPNTGQEYTPEERARLRDLSSA